MIFPLVKLGYISETVNILLAVLIGFFFGYALQRSGFTDSRKIARTFYLKDVDVPVVMFTAIATAAIGLWGLGLLGLMDMSRVYFLPTYLLPMVIAGFIFGMGMVIGGFCPGTAVASIFTGKLDAVVFIIGFLLGSLLFGDFMPVWKNLYEKDFRGVWRLDQLFDVNLGAVVFLVVVVAVLGSLGLRYLQHYFWGKDEETELEK